MRSLPLVLIFLFANSCIDRINFETNKESYTIVIDGVITDQPGPYTISILKASDINGILNLAEPAQSRKVTIYSDLGEEEVLQNKGGGVFETSPDGLLGKVGVSYYIEIVMSDGEVLISEPSKMQASGKIDSLYYQFESYKPNNGQTKYGFRIFVDSSSEEEALLRWRYSGVYLFRTYPEMHLFHNGCSGPPDPLPCSGFSYEGGILKRVEECTCCFCWVSEFEDKPHLSSESIVKGGVHRKEEVGFVPFDEVTFSQNKYMVRVEQMSLSQEAYDYWKIIRDQKEGASSLFQPSFGQVKTNFSSLVNPDRKIVGIFYASSIQKKILFIEGQDASIPVPTPSVDPTTVCLFWFNCEKPFINASRIPPPDWVD